MLKREPGARARRRAELAAKIRAVHGENRGVYGSPRMERALTVQGESICVNTMAPIMREQAIRARGKRKFTPRTTDSKHASPVAPNTLGQRFHAELPDQKWAADITYVPTGEGWLYVAAVIDPRGGLAKVVGWSMADHLRAELAGDALGMALARRGPAAGLLHHSDRGVQYPPRRTTTTSGCWANAASSAA